MIILEIPVIIAAKERPEGIHMPPVGFKFSLVF